MIVRDLLAALQNMDPEREVQAEGCQFCLHRVVGVHAYDGDGVTSDRDVVIETDA